MRVSQPGNKLQGNEPSSTKGLERSRELRNLDRTKPPAAKSTDHSGASAEISERSREFAQAKSIASQAPDVRESRVADLKKRLSEGTYKVDHDAVADRLVEDHLHMPL